MHLRHQDVRIVARVTNDGSVLSISLYIGAVRAEEQLRWVFTLKQKRVPHWAIAVQAFEIQLR